MALLKFSAKEMGKKLEAQKKAAAEKKRSASKATTASGVPLPQIIVAPKTQSLLKLNKTALFESALNRRTYAGLIMPSFTDKWWDHADFVKVLTERGFAIVNYDDGDFSQICQLSDSEIRAFEGFLIESHEKVKKISLKAKNKKLDRVLKGYKENYSTQIKVRRLVTLFVKLFNQSYLIKDDEEDAELCVPALSPLLEEVMKHIAKTLPNNFQEGFVSLMDSIDEYFNISWRFPGEPLVTTDGLTASNLNWLSSKYGNDSFLLLYEYINENIKSATSHVELKINSDEYGNTLFLDKKLTKIQFEMSAKDIKNIFEALGFGVDLAVKASNSTLRIGVK